MQKAIKNEDPAILDMRPMWTAPQSHAAAMQDRVVALCMVDLGT